MLIFILHILMLDRDASAARRPSGDVPAMTVFSRGSSEFLRAKYPNQKIEIVNQRSIAQEEAADGYVAPTARTALFLKTGLTSAMAKYDELDKDMLVMAVRDADQEEMNRLLKGYPNLTMDQLRRLKAALGAGQ